LFDGDVVNVSGWKDEDKEGGAYRDYFPSAASYTVTNFERGYGFQGRPGEVLLDLTVPVRDELRGKFDVVFNHTTLEHIYNTDLAFENLCAMSRDVVIIVVPFLQPVHEGEDNAYSDFWRFSPAAVRKMFEERGLHPLYVSYNDDWLRVWHRHATSCEVDDSIRLRVGGSAAPAGWSCRDQAPHDAVRAVPGLVTCRALFGSWRCSVRDSRSAHRCIHCRRRHRASLKQGRSTMSIRCGGTTPPAEKPHSRGRRSRTASHR